MDPVRIGLSLRALRRRRGWSQAQLGERSGLSRSAVSRVERGEGDRLTLRSIARMASVLGARIRVQVLWQGEELDRLLDHDHAHLVDWVVRRLTAAEWVVLPEATFQFGSERGAIDVLAWHPTTGHLLVIEVKSVVPDIQATLAGVDRKARVAPALARQRGWRPGSVSRILVLPNDRTARRRVAQFAATFEQALPARTVELRRWIDAPDRPIAGVLFVTGSPQAGARHRVRPVRAVPTHDPKPGA